MNSDMAYRELIAALNGVTAGKGLTEIVRSPPYGTQTRVGEALQAALAIEGSFPADHFDFVDAAFSKFGAKRPSDSIQVCAMALLKLASHREPRNPRESQHEMLSGRYDRLSDGRAFQYEASYTREYPRTYDAQIRFAEDAPQSEPRDRFKGPLLDIELSENDLRLLVRHAIETKIETCEVP